MGNERVRVDTTRLYNSGHSFARCHNMEIDQCNSFEKGPDDQAILRFHRLSARHIFVISIATMSANALSILLLPVPQLAVVGIFMSALVLFFVVVVGPQRVEIKGTTVRVSNFTTFHRWRTFDAEEVTAMRLLMPGHRGITMGMESTLKSSPARQWQRINIGIVSAAGTHRDIDSPLFLAFFAAVKTAHPGMTVGTLPKSYAGSMPRA